LPFELERAHKFENVCADGKVGNITEDDCKTERKKEQMWVSTLCLPDVS